MRAPNSHSGEIADRGPLASRHFEGKGSGGMWNWKPAKIVLEEHACMTLTAGLRASAFGVPFQPVGGVHGSDLAALATRAVPPVGRTWLPPVA